MTAALAEATDTHEWGTPTLKTFKRRFVRNVRTDTASTWVHVAIAPIVRELLVELDAAGTIPGYVQYGPDSENPNSPSHYGVKLGLPLTRQAQRWGFAACPGGIIFTGTIDEAHQLADEAQEVHALRAVTATASTTAAPPEDGKWGHNAPGVRPLTYGDKGDDVQFLQLVLNAGEQGGIFTEATDLAVKLFQRRYNLEETGDVGEAEWKLIIPRISKLSLGRGDAGFRVRVLQSLLVAYDWVADLDVTGRFGYRTSMVVKELQQDYGLRVNGSVRGPEWAVLFGRKLDS